MQAEITTGGLENMNNNHFRIGKYEQFSFLSLKIKFIWKYIEQDG